MSTQIHFCYRMNYLNICLHGLFSRITHMLGHKTNLHKLKNTEIIQCISSDHNSMNQKSITRKNNGQHTHTWRINSILLNNQWVNEEIKEKKYMETNKNDNTMVHNLWDAVKAVLRGIYSDKALPQEIRKISNNLG